MGRIRRNLRIHFSQEPTAPLDVGLDTLVEAPLSFAADSVSIPSAGGDVEIAGTKSSPGVEIVKCEPARGACRLVRLEQSPDQFSLHVLPLISFGSAQELFRIWYRDPEHQDEVVIDLPLELRSGSAVRFFPSVVPIDFQEGVWHATAKLVLAPGSKFDFGQLRHSIEARDGSILESSKYRVEFVQTSVVLYAMQLHCPGSHHDSDCPKRLFLTSSDGQCLATVEFSNP